jgi:hypothetical protein
VQTLAAPSGGLPSAWSVILLVIGLALFTMGIVETDAIAIVMGVMSGVGAVALHQVAKRARETRRQALIASLQMPVLKLAADRGGKLTVTEVAAEMNWSIHRAEKVLNSLDDGWRVSSEITDDGVIVYEFRELLFGPPRAGEASA